VACDFLFRRKVLNERFETFVLRDNVEGGGGGLGGDVSDVVSDMKVQGVPACAFDADILGVRSEALELVEVRMLLRYVEDAITDWLPRDDRGPAWTAGHACSFLAESMGHLDTTRRLVGRGVGTSAPAAIMRALVFRETKSRIRADAGFNLSSHFQTSALPPKGGVPRVAGTPPSGGSLVEQGQLLRQFPTLTESGAHFYESAHDKDTHLNRSAAMKDGGGHDGRVPPLRSQIVTLNDAFPQPHHE